MQVNKTNLTSVASHFSAEATSSLLKAYPYSSVTQRRAWIAWITDFPFRWYVTLTFRNPQRNGLAARETLRKFVLRFERAVYGRNRERKTVNQCLSMCVFVEQHASEGYHFHCLIQNPTDLGRTEKGSYLAHIKQCWGEVGGSYRGADIETIRTQLDVVTLTDYSTKTFAINTECIDITWFRARRD